MFSLIWSALSGAATLITVYKQIKTLQGAGSDALSQLSPAQLAQIQAMLPTWASQELASATGQGTQGGTVAQNAPSSSIPVNPQISQSIATGAISPTPMSKIPVGLGW